MKFRFLLVSLLSFFIGVMPTYAVEVTTLEAENGVVVTSETNESNGIVLLEGETKTSTTVNYCEGLKPTFMFIGHIIRLAKILIPIVIILFGMYDFFRAVTGSKDDEIKKSARSLMFRALAGVCIFFLPAIIDFVFSLVDGWSNSEYESNYQNCFKCVWDVGSCTK